MSDIEATLTEAIAYQRQIGGRHVTILSLARDEIVRLKAELRQRQSDQRYVCVSCKATCREIIDPKEAHNG